MAEQDQNAEYTVETAATRLGVSAATLNRWRSQGRGPAYRKRVGRVFYTEADIAAWDAQNMRTGTRTG